MKIVTLRMCVMAFMLVSLLVACSDSDGAADSTSASNGASTSNADVEATGFAVSASTFSLGGINSYVGVTPSLGADGAIVDNEVIEFQGLAVVSGRAGSGEFFVDSIAGPTLIKYSVENGLPVERGRLSFAALGFSTVQRVSGIAFISDTKALLLDSSTLQLLTWNPKEMVIERTEDLSDRLGRDVPAMGVFSTTVRDNTAFFFVSYTDTAADLIRPEAVVAAVDLEDGSVEVFTDDVCGEAVYVVLLENGDIYTASGPSNAAMDLLGREGTKASCLRRIPAGQKAFDPNFHPTIRELTGQHGGGLLRAADGKAYIRVIDESLAPSTGTSFGVLNSASWGWHLIDLNDPTSTEPVDLPNGGGLFVSFTISDAFYMSQSAPDFSSSTLLETTTDPPMSGLTARGVISNAAPY